jgi:phospholipase C
VALFRSTIQEEGIMRKRLRALIRQGVAGATALGMVATQAGVAGANRPDFPEGPQTATPIKHLVVIFGENISFDHYFGTYPNATNPSGEPTFRPSPGTPGINGLGIRSASTVLKL